MAALDVAVELARQRLWADAGMRRQPRARPRRRHRSRRLRRVQHHRQCGGGGQAHPRRRRRHGRADRRAVEPISARARSRPAVPRAWAQRRHGRLSRLRLHLHAADLAGRFAGSARSRHPSVRRRSRRPHGRRIARRRRRQRQADLQLSGRHAGNGGRRLSDSAARGRHAGRRTLFKFRRRPRLSVPVQLLHHHQRAGPQIALPHARRRRGHRARQRGAGHHAVLHHRRQFRPQPQLGADPRPPDRIARARQIQHPPAAASRHAVSPHPGFHREIGARRLHRYLPRAREHQPRNP